MPQTRDQILEDLLISIKKASALEVLAHVNYIN